MIVPKINITFRISLFLSFFLLFIASYGQMNQLLNTVGQYQIRADACGTDGVSCPIIIEKPITATTVFRVYAYFSTTGLVTATDPGPNVINLSGGSLPGGIVPMTNVTNSPSVTILGDVIDLYTRYEDVTTLFSVGLDAALAGSNITYTSSESITADIVGAGIIVVWNDPTVPNTIVHISLGSLSTRLLGSDTIITPPINTTFPGFSTSLGLGFAFSTGNFSQVSTVSINGTVLDPNAGGLDDGDVLMNGTLITLGGFGDSKTSFDDEYYDFSSFIVNGSTQIEYDVISSHTADWLNAVYFEIVGPTSVATDTIVSICFGDSLFLGGAFQFGSGMYSDTLMSSSGIDSIVNTTLSVDSFILTNSFLTICQGDSVFLGGAFRKNSGTYNDTLSSNFGCDSIVSTLLTVNLSYSNSLSVTICQGDSILIGGTYQTGSGTYRDSLQTALGCDSIIITSLSLKSVYNVSRSVSICDGDSVLLGGSYQTISGIYSDSLQTVFGCDSVITTTLTINPTSIISQAQTICQGDSIFLGGNLQTTSGTYRDSLQTIFGCDSIVITTLTVNSLPLISTNMDTTICSGDLISLNAFGGINYLWDNGLGIGSNQNISPNLSTLYTVIGTDANGCSNASSVLVSVTALVANIIPSTLNGLTPLTVTFGNGSSTGTGISYEWNFGNVVNNSQFEPVWEFLEIGIYEISLIVTDGVCSDTATVLIDVVGGASSIFIPNVFTPNKDGTNDVFQVTGVNLESEHGEIYNRWGRKLFSWLTVGGGWDGEAAADGTYFYIIRAEGMDGVKYLEKGTLSLIR